MENKLFSANNGFFFLNISTFTKDFNNINIKLYYIGIGVLRLYIIRYGDLFMGLKY